MNVFLTWLGTVVGALLPSVGAWIAPKTPVPTPPKASKPTTDDGDPAARKAAADRAAAASKPSP